MPITPEHGFTPFDVLPEITKFPDMPLPLFGDLVEGVPVDINFIETGYDDDCIDVPSSNNLVALNK